jgi:hypothetical protein
LFSNKTDGRILNTQSEEFDLEQISEHFECDQLIVRVVTAHSKKSSNAVIKRELKRKKKAPNAIGNMTSSATIIIMYCQQELFVKLFYNGKF